MTFQSYELTKHILRVHLFLYFQKVQLPQNFKLYVKLVLDSPEHC